MSLEAAIEANTKAVRDLISAIQLFKTVAIQAPVDTAPEPKVTPSPEPKVTPSPEPKVTPSTKVVALDPISYDQLAAMVTLLTKTHGRGKAIELLAEFGAKNLKEIPLEDYAEVARVAQMMIEA